MSFIRRYGYYPSTEQITQVEGVIIIDLPPPAGIQGAGTGVVAVVGEFADVTFAVDVASDGSVSTNMRPIEVYSAQDMLNKVGGWDASLGDWGGTNGNGFAAVTGKQFSRLICIPINNASSKGIRLWRKLPTNKSATSFQPIVPVTAGLVAAGRLFYDGANPVRVAKRVVFSDALPIAQSTTGAATSAGSSTEQVFTDASASFIAAGVKVGDAIVIGSLNAAALSANLLNADTYRITEVTSATALKVEKQDGSAFDWTTGTSIVYRIHAANCADTGGEHKLSQDGGASIPARPTSASVAASTALSPAVTPPSATGSSWDSLSGLKAQTTPNAAGLTYTANIQQANVTTNADLATEYSKALDVLLSDSVPAADINIVFSARQAGTATPNIATLLKNHVAAASASGKGRMAIIAPEIGATADTLDEVISASWPGVSANRAERVVYSWPPCRTSVLEAQNVAIKTALGSYTTDGILDMPMDSYVASVLSVLAPERNPGQAAPPATTALAGVLGFARGIPSLGINDYTTMRAQGICGLRIDRSVGPLLQSGITSSLTPGEKNIARRRMADYIEDSIAAALMQFNKLPLSNQLKDGVLAQIDGFLSALLSADNPSAQRISGYQIDDKSGNTPALEAQGVYVVIIKVRTLASADFLVLQAEIGEGVNVTAQ